MKETYGVPVEEIQEAIKHGVRKINIDTDIRLAMTAAVRKFFADNPSKFDPREFLKPAREAAKLVCKQRYQQFGCAGHEPAGSMPIALEKMAQRLSLRRTEPARSLSAPPPHRPFAIIAIMSIRAER